MKRDVEGRHERVIASSCVLTRVPVGKKWAIEGLGGVVLPPPPPVRGTFSGPRSRLPNVGGIQRVCERVMDEKVYEDVCEWI